MFKQTFDLFPEDMWVTAVQVATVWTNPESARKVDEKGTANPTDIEGWVRDLSFQEKLALCDDNRVQTQTLYGEPVIVTKIEADFAHVIVPSQPSVKDARGYPGWIALRQLKKVKKKDWVQPKSAITVHDKVWTLKNGEKETKLSYLTILPVLKEYEESVIVVTPHGIRELPKDAVHIFATEEGIPGGTPKDMIESVQSFIGLDYFWGGMSSFGYDCSGLSYAAHKRNGMCIPRDASDQAREGEEVPLNDLQRGDLLFFAYEEGKGKIHHVGIYVGNGKMLHSPQTGKGVELIELAGTKYEKELCMARRYWNRVVEIDEERKDTTS